MRQLNFSSGTCYLYPTGAGSIPGCRCRSDHLLPLDDTTVGVGLDWPNQQLQLDVAAVGVELDQSNRLLQVRPPVLA